ncbi:MAG: hypothetical protein LC123_07905, partial [Burkholderiales bacterium]|nr:hypothetical protein [Burkholderiales bacterium]
MKKDRAFWAVWTIAAFALLALNITLNLPPARAQQVPNTPVAVAKVFNTAATADTDILPDDFTVPERLGNCAFRVMILVDTETEFRLAITSGETTKPGDFNGGTALAAGKLYTFTFSAFAVSDDEDEMTYNFQLDDNANVDFLLVERIK